MRVGITGTPGTGKTSLSKHISRNVISLKEFAIENDLGNNSDDVFEVDIEEADRSLPQDCWVEGHLAHKIELDYCIVLRTRPDVLRERLNNRNYSKEKVEENIEAEKMDLILSESVQKHKVYEINTTGRDPSDVAEEAEKAVGEKKERVGVVNWSEYL